MADEVPKGVVAVFVGPDGREIASVADFDLGGYGGHTLLQSQTVRVRSEIAIKVADALASSEFTKHIDNYAKRQVLAEMERRDGYRLHIIPVGHEAEE